MGLESLSMHTPLLAKQNYRPPSVVKVFVHPKPLILSVIFLYKSPQTKKKKPHSKPVQNLAIGKMPYMS